MSLCSCHSGREYEECCKPFHSGETVAPTALALMRSRYCAYALGLIEYIIDTTHPNHPDFQLEREVWKKRIQEFCDQTSFEDLEIVEVKDGVKESYVTFKAYLKQQNKDVSFVERSQFLKENGKWFYLRGDLV